MYTTTLQFYVTMATKNELTKYVYYHVPTTLPWQLRTKYVYYHVPTTLPWQLRTKHVYYHVPTTLPWQLRTINEVCILPRSDYVTMATNPNLSLQDHQVLLQSILASPYVKELHSRAETWLVLLQQLHVIMHLWPVCHTNVNNSKQVSSS